MKNFLILFLLTTNLYAQDIFLENAVPTDNLINSDDYKTTLKKIYLTTPNKTYYEGVASNASKFLNGTTSDVKCDTISTNEGKALCYERLANNQLYSLQVYLKEALDASNDSSLNIENNYISNVINEVFSNVVDIKGEFTPNVIDDVSSNKISFYANNVKLNNEVV